MVLPITTVRIQADPRADHPTEDLREVVGERGLIELALQAVELFGSELPLWQHSTPPGFSSRMLLALLTYSYVAGIYSSEDVHWASRSDHGARYLSANTWPDERSLRRFRRAWQPVLRACLQWVQAKAEEMRCIQSGEFGLSIVDFRHLAEQRIETSLLMDLAND